MGNIDVIGIGAINFDYIFFCKSLEYKNRKVPEAGQEYLNEGKEAIYEDINKLLYTTEHTNQVCGSAYFALKTIHSIDPELKLSYVGVCGKPTNKELNAGFNVDYIREFDFLYNKEWLFFDDDSPGIALVRVMKGTRSWIDIDPGANSKLETYIKEKEKKEGENEFVDFLIKSKWIHISSLSDINQFNYIVQKLKQAKERNPLIKISVDPGYEYTKRYKIELREIFSIADYVFLNNNELENLIGDNSLTERNKYNVLSSIFNYFNLSDTQVIIIKSQCKHTLASFKKGQILISNFWHKKLWGRKILNDTGAGDAFAGGFIASMLSKRLLIHQPMSISVGAIAAASRMQCKDSPFSAIANETNDYIDNIQKSEIDNYKQRIMLYISQIKKHIPTFVIGIITGVIGSLIVWWLQFLTATT